MRALELFAGAGGLGLGVSRAGFTSQGVIEWNSYCCETLLQNKGIGLEYVRDWPVQQADVKDIDFREYEGVDLVSGGPPCQPFSVGGKHRGPQDARDMFPQAVRAVREAKPKAFLFENVKGLTRTTFASYFEYVRLQLTYPELRRRQEEVWSDHMSRLEQHHVHGRSEGLEYRLLTRVLNAADYGVPQKRERVFFVGFRSDLDREWSFPNPTHSLESLIWEQYRSGTYWDRHKLGVTERRTDARLRSRAWGVAECPDALPWQTIRDAICDLPDPRNISLLIPNHQYQPGARQYPGHTGSPIDEPAKTLKAGDHGVPGGENMLLDTDESVRYFTIRESARIQTFPDEYLFHGSWTETMRQLGNAVPVRLAQIVAKSVMDQLTAN